jgi:hypothetical protein
MSKPAPTTTGMSVTGTASEVQGAWVAWMELAAPEDRAVLADLLAKHDLTTLASVNAFNKDIVIEMFRGTVSPAVALAAKPFLDTICANVHAMHAVQPDSKGHALMAMMLEVKRGMRPLQPVYTAPMIVDQGDDDDEDNELERVHVGAQESEE